MLTIHCYVCGADERLRGHVGGPNSPLDQFRELHPHAQGSGRCRITCPCGESHELVQEQEEFDSDRANDTVLWYRQHEAHVRAADSNEAADGWTEWL